ncbi:hypothetical protein [Actinospongicola halichondriae]|uniref:hypothetical protein n=1 Tax=Actinospongicola halichondriae TaxID=3236844 RepID=UPI003D4038AE
MAQRSTFLVHLTPDGSVWVEAVATGAVFSASRLDLVGDAIEQWLSDAANSEDMGEVAS